ncbi:hypothetical protein B0F88_10399 [Methylobacter tundripaludum]|uniref:Uncharacterized protein n=1 Tax=Methylobacter tundripaludum TaxID=173365 RepID=A0A2S6H5K1_9GAMM|nr:hypothetical protein B0F88_10399 [Methylobacter tundripaludum]
MSLFKKVYRVDYLVKTLGNEKLLPNLGTY